MISQEFPTLYSMGTGRRMSGQTLMRSGVRHGSGGCQFFLFFFAVVCGRGGGRVCRNTTATNIRKHTSFSNIICV